MTTYTSHGAHCHECNQLAHDTQQEATETGKAQHRIVSRNTKLHVAATINDGSNKRLAGDRTNGKDTPQ